MLLAELDRRRRTNRLATYKPYAKQREFHLAGASYRERLFMAGNQLGKTLAGAAEGAMHLTGAYPDDWDGHRFTKPIVMLAGSESYELTRDGVQRLMVGPPMSEEEWGTGFIPQSSIVDTTRRSGVSGALDTVTVKHSSGGTSTLLFKAYEQGRGKWQANTVDYVWFDEEPPEDVYFEGITRTNATRGLIAVTFTPLKGMSEVVRRFVMETHPDRAVTTMTIDDAEHYSPEERAKIIASYPPHEREARTKGVPVLGSGRIFPVAEEDISIEAFRLPEFWPRIGAMDFGWDHPFAAVELVFDPEGDVVYVTKTYRARQETPILHAKSLIAWGDWLPWAWPHDGLQHSKDSGEPLAKQYKGNGLKMLGSHASFADGSTGVEAGLFDILERMETGRFKVFSHLSDWFEEFRLYHRKDGKVVKEHDDLMAATRYAVMSLRHAIVKPSAFKKRETRIADPLGAYRTRR